MRVRLVLLLRCGFLCLLMLVVACRPKEVGLPTLTPAPSRDVPTPTSTPVPPPPTPTPVVYVVQPGDSLSLIATKYDVPQDLLAQANGIDDPNVIAVGQQLIIPGPTPVPTATVLPTDTPTPDVPPQLEIADVIGRGAPNAETVIIVNRGRDVLLHRWTLRDAQGNAYVFPNVYLVSGAELRVHTGTGEDMPQHLYWNREAAVWEEAGDVAVLADERGVMYAARPLE